MVVLDTSALSAIMHRLPGALEGLSRLPPQEVVLCAPVLAEIHFGLERLPAGSRRRVLLEGELARILALVQPQCWSLEAARVFGQIKAELERAGAPIQDMDVAIASIALVLEASVATANVRHFGRVAGLEVQDWTNHSHRSSVNPPSGDPQPR